VAHEREAPHGLPLAALSRRAAYPHLPAASATGANAAKSAVSVTEKATRRLVMDPPFLFPSCSKQPSWEEDSVLPLWRR
jgi:hypothetical protein